MTEITIPNGELTHEDIEAVFCELVNIVEPDHPYYSDSPYPITPSDVKYGYKQASSSLYASCGPRRKYKSNIVSFSADLESFNNRTENELLAVYTHEMTHITVGSHSDEEHGGHPPRFWREMGFNAHLLLDNWDEVSQIFPNATKEGFIGRIISNEINPYNIDRRYGDVTKRRQEMARWFKNTLQS